MVRSLRIEYPGAVHHVTARGNGRQQLYLDVDDLRRFVSDLGAVIGRYGLVCHAYCAMPNHYHLLVETPRANLKRAIQHLNGVYAQAFNRRHDRVGHVFGGRYKAVLVERDAHLLELCRYVVLNPLRWRPPLATLDEWRWSSYRATVGLEPAPPWLTVDWVLAQFGSRRAEARAEYAAFVAAGLGSDPWSELRGGIYLGSSEFAANSAQDRDELIDVPRDHLRPERRSLSDIFATEGERAILVAHVDHEYRLTEIAAFCGLHYSSVSRRLSRLLAEL
jgi:REP element-mobilizing transposase RayT